MKTVITTTKKAIVRLLSSYVAVPKEFLRVTGDLNAAMFLSYLFGWCDKGADAEGWIFKSVSEIQDDTLLTKKQQARVKDILVGLGILEEKMRANHQQMFLRVNIERLMELIEHDQVTPETVLTVDRDEFAENEQTGGDLSAPGSEAGDLLSLSPKGASDLLSPGRLPKVTGISTNTQLILKTEESLRDSLSAGADQVIGPEGLVTLYNHYADQSGCWPKCKGIGAGDRLRYAIARIKQMPARGAWSEFFARALRSDQLSGRNRLSRPANHRNWNPTFDWFISHTNFLKVQEGKYDNRVVIPGEAQVGQNTGGPSVENMVAKAEAGIKSIVEDLRRAASANLDSVPSVAAEISRSADALATMRVEADRITDVDATLAVESATLVQRVYDSLPSNTKEGIENMVEKSLAALKFTHEGTRNRTRQRYIAKLVQEKFKLPSMDIAWT